MTIEKSWNKSFSSRYTVYLYLKEQFHLILLSFKHACLCSSLSLAPLHHLTHSYGRYMIAEKVIDSLRFLSCELWLYLYAHDNALVIHVLVRTKRTQPNNIWHILFHHLWIMIYLKHHYSFYWQVTRE